MANFEARIGCKSGLASGAQEGFTAGVPDEPTLAAVGAGDAEAAGEYLREDGFAVAKVAGKAAKNRLTTAGGDCTRATTTFAIGG
jgi:hypothetical protein